MGLQYSGILWYYIIISLNNLSLLLLEYRQSLFNGHFFSNCSNLQLTLAEQVVVMTDPWGYSYCTIPEIT